MFGFIRKKAKNRRQLPRIPMPESEGQMIVRSVHSKDRMHAKILDINHRGVRFRGTKLNGMVARGDHVEVNFPVPQNPIILQGEIMWVDANVGDGQYEAGILFEVPPHHQRERILEYIDRVKKMTGFAGESPLFPGDLGGDL